MCLGVPGRIESIAEAADPLLRSGRVSFGGAIREVNLACVPEAATGDYVIVHAGFAISRIDETEARDIMQTLREMEGAASDGGPLSAEESAT